MLPGKVCVVMIYWGKVCGRWKNRKEHMTAPITLAPVDPEPQASLRRRYEETPKVESRTRYQMILLALQGYKVPQIARIVLRSEDTVARVLKRFEARRIGCGTSAHATRPSAQGHSSVGSRIATRDRAASS